MLGRAGSGLDDSVTAGSYDPLAFEADASLGPRNSEDTLMHLQVRTAPVASPPDVEKLLRRLADDGVNLVAIGGSNVEFGGELAFVPQHDHEDRAFAVLDRHEYPYRVLHVDQDEGLSLCEVPNEPGALHKCLAQISEENLAKGRIIRDILIGVPDADDAANGLVPVQVYSEQVRTPAALSGSDPAP